MRRKAKRDLMALAGVAVVLVAVVFANLTFQRQGLWEHYENLRLEAEKERKSKGYNLLDWELLQMTTGSVRKGATYNEVLLAKDSDPINLMGYMQPLNEFRNMSEFMMLPVPIECYFCKRPPMRDMVLIHLEEGQTAQLVKDPMLVNGTLTLNKEPGSKFFYTVDDANIGPGKEGSTPERRDIPTEHMQPKHTPTEEKQLMPGREAPKAITLD
jgi:hypothetical protein